AREEEVAEESRQVDAGIPDRGGETIEALRLLPLGGGGADFLLDRGEARRDPPQLDEGLLPSPPGPGEGRESVRRDERDGEGGRERRAEDGPPRAGESTFRGKQVERGGVLRRRRRGEGGGPGDVGDRAERPHPSLEQAVAREGPEGRDRARLR